MEEDTSTTTVEEEEQAPTSSLKDTLQSVSDQLHSEFRGSAAQDRLTQFDSHLATLQMVIDHLYDESARMRGPNGQDIYRNSEG